MADRDRQVENVSLTAQERILVAAIEVFAERGYSETTTRAICAAARVNVALVNYYYRSKADLYKMVIAHLFDRIAKPLLSIPDSVKDAASWQAAVDTWVRRTLAVCVATEPPECYVAKLMGWEQSVPEELALEIELSFLAPLRQCLARLIRMALPDATSDLIGHWCSSVHAQLFVYAIANPSWVSRFCPSGVDVNLWLEGTADHICQGIFSRLAFQKAEP